MTRKEESVDFHTLARLPDYRLGFQNQISA